MSDETIRAIKDGHYLDLVGREVFMVEGTDYGWRVQHWTKDGVAPQSDYDTPHEAAARLLQIMGIKEPVKPQDWPERVCVGRIDME